MSRAKRFLDDVLGLVTGPRQQAYDHPSANHTQTADLWSAYLRRKLKEPIDARDVCWMQNLLKASRDSHHRQRDNLLDGAGYLSNADSLDEGAPPRPYIRPAIEEWVEHGNNETYAEYCKRTNGAPPPTQEHDWTAPSQNFRWDK